MDPKNDSKPVPVLAQVYKFVRYNYFLVIFLSAIFNKYCSCIYRYNQKEREFNLIVDKFGEGHTAYMGRQGQCLSSFFGLSTAKVFQD